MRTFEKADSPREGVVCFTTTPKPNGELHGPVHPIHPGPVEKDCTSKWLCLFKLQKQRMVMTSVAFAEAEILTRNQTPSG